MGELKILKARTRLEAPGEGHTNILEEGNYKYPEGGRV